VHVCAITLLICIVAAEQSYQRGRGRTVLDAGDRQDRGAYSRHALGAEALGVARRAAAASRTSQHVADHTLAARARVDRVRHQRTARVWVQRVRRDLSSMVCECVRSREHEYSLAFVLLVYDVLV
jgi:hypothetical protein